MKFIITIDTEADDQWSKKKNIKLENIGFLVRFQNLCEKYNFKPSYLVSYEVANDINSVKILKKWQDKNRAEIGAHLHPWTTPPYFLYDKNFKSFPSELSDNDLFLKLESLTKKIKESFGKNPISFRAGRWGFSKEMARSLISLGYKVDSSVTPKINWSSFKGKENGKGGRILEGRIFILIICYLVIRKFLKCR